MSIRDKLLKNSTIKLTSILEESILFSEKDVCSTGVPAVNIALSGDMNGGLLPGLIQLAGPSKHFKTAFSLLIATSFLQKYEDGVILFYDSEFGTPLSYFDSFGINKRRVVHTPLTNIEELKHDIMTQLDGIERGEKVCIIIDSIGNLASKKEVDDALEGKSAADMTRAKMLKSLGRMVTPHLSLKNITLIAINHVYKEMGLFPKDIVSGGTGMYLSSDNIWIIGRKQDKDADGLAGYHFIINIEKSRYVREKTKIPISVSFEAGISKWSGMFDIALEAGVIKEAKKSWYTVDGEKNFRRGDVETDSGFWDIMSQDPALLEYIDKTYKLSSGPMLTKESTSVR